MKSILEDLKVLKMPFLPFLGSKFCWVFWKYWNVGQINRTLKILWLIIISPILSQCSVSTTAYAQGSGMIGDHTQLETKLSYKKLSIYPKASLNLNSSWEWRSRALYQEYRKVYQTSKNFLVDLALGTQKVSWNQLLRGGKYFWSKHNIQKAQHIFFGDSMRLYKKLLSAKGF